MKKALSLGLMIGFFFVLFSSLANNSAVAATTPFFSDVPTNNPHYKAIEYLKNHNVISGYPDGTFRPNQVVDRVEALKFILLGSGISTQTSTKVATFSDTHQGEWYSPYLNKAFELGIIQGYPDGTFKPTQTVNLVENLKILVSANKIDLSKIKISENPYADALMNQWYTPYVQYAKNNRLVDADTQNKIYPSRGMTRADLAETMYRLMTLDSNQTTTSPSPVSTPLPPPQSTNLYDLSGLVLTLNIQNSAFSKTSMTVGTGTTVKWINMDTMAHTVTSDDGKFDSGTIAPGQSFSFTFKDMGAYNYHCSLDPNMKASIVVKPAIEVPSI